MSNPLNNIPNIEDAEPIEPRRQMSAQEEQAYLKAPYYAMKAKMELAFEQVFTELYATLLEKTQQVEVLSKELAELKQKVTKKQQKVTDSSVPTRN